MDYEWRTNQIQLCAAGWLNAARCRGPNLPGAPAAVTEWLENVSSGTKSWNAGPWHGRHLPDRYHQQRGDRHTADSQAQVWSLTIPRTLNMQTVYGKRGDLSIIVQKIAGNWWQIVSACVRWPDNSAPCIHSPALDISCHTQQHAHCGATCPVAGIWNNVNI